VPMEILPEIRSSSEVYGFLRDGPLKGLPIAGVKVHFYKSLAI
jgi:glycerol kinase